MIVRLTRYKSPYYRIQAEYTADGERVKSLFRTTDEAVSFLKAIYGKRIRVIHNERN